MNLLSIFPTKFRPSALHLFVFAFFAVLLLVYVVITGDLRILIWALPTLVLLILIPMGMTYLSQSEYEDLTPIYEAESKTVKIREINEHMIGKPVKIVGLVEEARFKLLNRPHFIVSDRTGTITVKMFTSPRTDINKDDVVEVYGQVIRRYFVTGSPVLNGVHIRKTK